MTESLIFSIGNSHLVACCIMIPILILLFDISVQKPERFSPDFPDSPERELFLWAVLFNRQELANIFWRMGKDHIGKPQSSNSFSGFLLFGKTSCV